MGDLLDRSVLNATAAEDRRETDGSPGDWLWEPNPGKPLQWTGGLGS